MMKVMMKVMRMKNSLRNKVIRLAYEKPELREVLLPLVKAANYSGETKEKLQEMKQVLLGHMTQYPAMAAPFSSEIAKIDKELTKRLQSENAGNSGSPIDSIDIGDIWYSSWGYDQTNIDFYQVFKKTRTMIGLVQIEKKVVSGRGNPQEKVMPLKGRKKPRGNTFGRKKVQVYRDEPYVSLSSYDIAYPWDGKAKSQTGSRYGH